MQVLNDEVRKNFYEDVLCFISLFTGIFFNYINLTLGWRDWGEPRKWSVSIYPLQADIRNSEFQKTNISANLNDKTFNTGTGIID